MMAPSDRSQRVDQISDICVADCGQQIAGVGIVILFVVVERTNATKVPSPQHCPDLFLLPLMIHNPRKVLTKLKLTGNFGRGFLDNLEEQVIVGVTDQIEGSLVVLLCLIDTVTNICDVPDLVVARVCGRL